MEFLLLGPLEVRRGGDVVEVRGSKRRTLLAMLVLHANEVVRTDRLVEELWGGHPPSSAAAALQSHVSRLRKDLGEDVVGTKPWGYVLRADPPMIDLRRFEAVVAEARTLPAEERAAALRAALALWRGPPLADLANEPALVGHIERLEELRLSALEQRIDADLETGTHSELVPELENLVARQPLRERLRGQLILALYRAGRQAEALETYRETRRVLVDELGIEPSAELRELEQAILRQDPSLTIAPSAHAPTPPDDRGFRWPRSPLALAAAVALIAAVTAAVVQTRGAPSPSRATPSRHPPRTVQPQQATAPTSAAELRLRKRTSKPRPGTARVVRANTRTTPPRSASRQPEPLRPAVAAAQPTAEAKSSATAETHGATTTVAKAPSEPPLLKPEPFTIADDFSRAPFDATIWHIVGRDFGAVFDQRTGRLEITLLADAQPDPAYDQVGGHYGTRCRYTADFDASVEFELLTWPTRSGAYAGLAAYFADSAVVRQNSPQWGDQYASWVSRANGAIPLEDRQGKLRLRRIGSTITTYFWYDGGWRTIVSGTSTGPATLGLQLQANGGEFAHTEVRVAYDNFVVTASDADCPPGSDPRTP